MTISELCDKFKEFFPHIAISSAEGITENAITITYSFIKPDNLPHPDYRAVFSYNADDDWGFMTVSEAR